MLFRSVAAFAAAKLDDGGGERSVRCGVRAVASELAERAVDHGSRLGRGIHGLDVGKGNSVFPAEESPGLGGIATGGGGLDGHYVLLVVFHVVVPIQADSAEGEGSRFSFMLPLKQAD